MTIEFTETEMNEMSDFDYENLIQDMIEISETVQLLSEIDDSQIAFD